MQNHYPTAPASQKDLDEGLKETFPASDTPSMVTHLTASPTSDAVPARQVSTEHPEVVTIYRVVDESQKDKPFGNEGNADARRWTSEGTPAVYASLSPSTALLEFLAHGGGRGKVWLAKAHIPRSRMVVLTNYPSTWRERPYRDDVRQIGDNWAKSHQSLAAEVPSVLCTGSCNVLINPDHVDAPLIQGVCVEPLELDDRLCGVQPG